MTHRYEFTLWTACIVLGIHFLEEYALDFRGWFEYVLHTPVTWEQYHLVNVSVILLAVACAAIGWRLPAVSLVLPAVLIVNAVFHIGSSLVWRYSPGAATSGFLFVPVGVWTFVGARRDGVLSAAAASWAAAGAVAFHLCMLAFFLIGPPGR